VGQQLHSVVEELRMAARQQPANVDETSMGRGRWLWVIVTAVATVYQIVRGRNRDALRKLLGCSPDAHGIPIWDRQRSWVSLSRLTIRLKTDHGSDSYA
jgi:transposase